VFLGNDAGERSQLSGNGRCVQPVIDQVADCAGQLLVVDWIVLLIEYVALDHFVLRRRVGIEAR